MPAVAEVLEIIELLPDWTELGPRDYDSRQKLVGLLRHNVVTYDLDVIREAIARFVPIMHARANSRQIVEDMGRLYVLNKFLFNLPEKETSDKARRFGGWWPMGDVEAGNLMWPYSYTAEGELTLTGEHSTYNGGAYDALAAFDYYAKTYGRRVFPNTDRSN